jgi:hypothetical protein
LTALYPENRKITVKGGVEMRKIIISVQNRLLGDALVSILGGKNNPHKYGITVIARASK